jgi:hypothetical protein
MPLEKGKGKQGSKVKAYLPKQNNMSKSKSTKNAPRGGK